MDIQRQSWQSVVGFLCNVNVREGTHKKQTRCYFDHIDQVKRGLRPRSPRPSGPLVRNGRAASLGGVFA